MSLVQTVRGPVEASALGRTLTHEHVVMSSPQFARDYPDLAWPRGRDAEIQRVTELLRQVKAGGIDTIVDCTAMMHDRDMEFLAAVNAGVDLHIVASTGIYTYDDLPYHIAHRAPALGERDILTTMFVRDLEKGIGDSGIRAHNIKVATDVPGVTPNIERVLRAAARAAVETGACITTHTQASLRSGLEQLRIFREEGVDLTRVVIGHCGDSTDLDYLRQLLDAGSTIASDRFGLNGEGRADEVQRIETVARLCAEGYAGQIVLAHDSLMCCDWLDDFSHYPDTWTPTYLCAEVLDRMRTAGVSDGDIERMLVEAPARVLSGATVTA